MKSFNICLLLSFITVTSLFAQEIDTIPIDTKGFEIKLKRSPLPTKVGSIPFKPVKIAPVVVDQKVNYWNIKTSIGINVNQSTFSNNWKGGGVNSLAVGGTVNYTAAYSKESYSYTSQVILEYGKVNNKDQLQKKTRDRIFWDNKAGLQLSKSWYFIGAVTFESQFDKGYNYYRDGQNVEQQTLISQFMAPGYLTESIGFEYRPNGYFSTRLGTGTAKQTFILDTAIYTDPAKGDFYGVPRGKKFINELAFQVTSEFNKPVFKNVNLHLKYTMFIPYDRPIVNIDHRFDLELKSQVNKFMNVSITGVGLMDKDADQEIQANQTLSLGFAFTFPR